MNAVGKKQVIKIRANNSYFSDFLINASGEAVVITAVKPPVFSQFEESSVELNTVIENLNRLGVEHHLVEA